MPVHLTEWHRLPASRLAVPLALLLALLVIASTEFGHRAEEAANAARDDAVRVQQAVGRVRRLVLLMESSERGYLLTGRPEYRAPYDEARAQAVAALAELRSQAVAKPARREPMLQLAEAAERKLSELAEVLRLFDAGERERAVTLVLTDLGREQMERVNDLVDRVVAAEQLEYARGDGQRERVRLWSRVALVSLMLLCLGAVFAARRLLGERDRERARHLADLGAERDKLEAEVRRRTQELSDLARHLQTVREDERSRLARELHDELGGLLTAAKLDVARVRRRLPGPAPELAERIDHLAQTLDAGIALKRRIIEDLRPSTLAHLGLQRTLQILCDEFARRAEVAVDAEIGELELADERALAIYRVVQEALTNVAKYAQARRVRVRVQAAGDAAEVEVGDDGVGFDPARIRVGAHGLAGMRFRVESFGGRWQLQSAPGRGTRVLARVPFAGPAGAPPA